MRRDVIAHQTATKRKPGDPVRPPLHTTQEIARALGVSTITLANHLKKPGAPQPFGRRKTASGTHSFYDPRVVKAWWATIMKVN